MENNCGIWTGQLIAGYYIRKMSDVITAQTNSGQRTWKAMSSNTTGDKIAAVVNNGYIYTSNDYGTSWKELTNSGIKAWTSICINSTGQILAATVNTGFIYTSNDYGETWIPRVMDAVRTWLSICINSTGDKLAACGYDIAVIYLSSNGGETWTTTAALEDLSIFDKHGYSGICCDPTGTYLATVGVIRRASNVQYSGRLRVSNDSGSTWIRWNIAASTSRLYSICCNNAFNKIIFSVNALIYTLDYDKTTNALSNQKIITTGSTIINGLCSNNSGNILGLVDNNNIYVSTDYGVTWISRNVTKSWVTICSISAHNKLLAVLTSDYIYKISFYYISNGRILTDILQSGTATNASNFKINGTDFNTLFKAYSSGYKAIFNQNFFADSNNTIMTTKAIG